MIPCILYLEQTNFKDILRYIKELCNTNVTIVQLGEDISQYTDMFICSDEPINTYSWFMSLSDYVVSTESTIDFHFMSSAALELLLCYSTKTPINTRNLFTPNIIKGVKNSDLNYPVIYNNDYFLDLSTVIKAEVLLKIKDTNYTLVGAHLNARNKETYTFFSPWATLDKNKINTSAIFLRQLLKIGDYGDSELGAPQVT